MQEFRGRKAVVTGGGSGIGRGIALSLAQEGMDVAIADIEPDSAQRVSEELKGLGVASMAVQADVTDMDSLDALAEEVLSSFGTVHLLSNNAGVNYQGLLEDATDDDWNWVMSANLYGLVRSVRAFLPILKRESGSHIINTTSMASFVALDFLHVGVYSASKYAAIAYSETLRGELAPYGIGVSVLCPGMVRSNLAATSARNRPAQFGGPMPIPEPNMTPELEAQMIEAEEVGQTVVRALRAGRFYIVTHPHTKPIVEHRFREILADFDAEASARNP
jgi:NAD(P)-dependent dehydrogenase (short-subunit alcohol dehydrogenase family)